MASRKRRTPVASPMPPQQVGIQGNHYSQAGPTLSADQFAHNWGAPTMEGDMTALFNDQNLYDYAGNFGPTVGQTNHSRVVSLDGMEDAPAVGADVPSGQLVRRNPNHQLAPRGRNAWDAFSNDKQGEWPPVPDEDDDLEQKALMARRDAQSKRKQIPPFVQKLSSFLDDNKNTNLIRWSDDGNSFIVLDEDEFARTLIPELFKHNNYASFVRQLNMYGFHKKVGLSDNSMKASEMKSKAPSEYYNKYFKRGRPELLWLIQKPKNASHPKRKRDDDGKPDSEEERKYQDAGGSGGYGEDLAVRGNQDMAMIPRTEYNSLRNEVRALQQQQKAISQVLSSIRRQNDQLYQQATAFQTLHDRHENSINAILTFLATFYNRSLEGGSGTNLADLFHPSMAQQQPRGNVVDVDDFPEKDFKEFAKSPTMHMQRPNRRSLALLPAPVAKDGATKGDRAATLSPSILSTAGSPRSKSNVRPPPFKSPAMSRSTSSSAGLGSQPPTSGRVTTQTNIETPPAAQGPQPLAQNEEIMSHIQNVNAATSPATTQGSQLNDHLSAALASYQTQNGNLPLTPQQRNDMLSLMANNVSAASPTSSVAKNSNNAMVNPQPPAIPDLTELHETQNQLELLRRLSDGTSTRIQHLQERLQPLSPSGQIPGIGQDSYFDNVPLGDPSQYDLDMGSFVNDDFFPEGNPTVTDASATTSVPATAGQNGPLPATADPTETNPLAWDGFGVSGDAGNTGPAIHGADINNDELFGDNGANGDDGRFESLSSSTTSPSATADVLDDGEQQSIRSPKRMRK